MVGYVCLAFFLLLIPGLPGWVVGVAEWREMSKRFCITMTRPTDRNSDGGNLC